MSFSKVQNCPSICVVTEPTRISDHSLGSLCHRLEGLCLSLAIKKEKKSIERTSAKGKEMLLCMKKKKIKRKDIKQYDIKGMERHGPNGRLLTRLSPLAHNWMITHDSQFNSSNRYIQVLSQSRLF